MFRVIIGVVIGLALTLPFPRPIDCFSNHITDTEFKNSCTIDGPIRLYDSSVNRRILGNFKHAMVIEVRP